MVANYKRVIQHYNSAPEEIQNYFPLFVELVEKYDWVVSISYVFTLIEMAKRRTIYCGIVKIHQCDSELTKKIVNQDHMDRGRFLDLFYVVYRKKVPNALLQKLKKGENVRDKIAHGIQFHKYEAREGLVETISFAKEFNEFVYGLAQFKPFSDLRGFKGRKTNLPKPTSRWVLQGMGLIGK